VSFRTARAHYLEIGRADEAADSLFMAAQAALAGGSDTGTVEQLLVDVLSEEPGDPQISARAQELLVQFRGLDRELWQAA
jgi:hypothetical protein